MLPVILSKEAENDFKRLPKVEQKKIIKKIKLLQSEPLVGKPLVGQLKGLRSCRSWPYRILYEVTHSSVNILRILHRQGVYK